MITSNRTDRGNGLTHELVQDIRGGRERYWEEETQEVFGGTVRRRTRVYRSYETYSTAKEDGRLVWGSWN